MISCFSDSLTGTAGNRGLHLAQECIGHFGLITRAAAGRTGFKSSPFGLFKSFDFYFFGSPVHHFFQVQFNADAQIRAFHPSGAALLLSESATEMPTENITEMRENIFHIHSATTESACSANPCMPELVIACLFLSIAQNFVSFSRF